MNPLSTTVNPLVSSPRLSFQGFPWIIPRCTNHSNAIVNTIYSVRNIIWRPESVSTISDISPTFNPKVGSSNGFCIIPRVKLPRSPPSRNDPQSDRSFAMLQKLSYRLCCPWLLPISCSFKRMPDSSFSASCFVARSCSATSFRSRARFTSCEHLQCHRRSR